MDIVASVTGKELLAHFKFFLFDADGVLWLGGKTLPGAVQFIHHLLTNDKRVLIVSNNSTRTIDEYVSKFKALGFDLISNEHIVSPAKVVAHLLANNGPKLPVYLVGSPGLEKELLREGVESFGVGPDHAEKYTQSTAIQEIDVSRPVKAVIVSYDVHISFPKIMKAINYISQPGVQFIATNEDASLPGPVKGVLIPGAGVNVAAVEKGAGKRPIVIGKPAKPIFEYIRKNCSVDAEKAVMLGDRCDTDIKFGRDNGMKAVLVGTGVSSLEDVRRFREEGRADLVPDYYAPSIQHLFSTL